MSKNKPVKRIPIQAAKDVAKKYKQNQVAIVTFDKTTGITHVITYGISVEECKQAALLGNLIKEHVLKWPKDQCNAVPSRAKKPHDPMDLDLDEYVKFAEDMGAKRVDY